MYFSQVARNQQADSLKDNLKGMQHSGFSLIEIMIVLVIIGLLAATVAYNVATYVDRGRTDKARMDIAALENAIKSYYADTGHYPEPNNWQEVIVPKYIERLPKDPWGNNYQYEQPGRERAFDVICFGADGREGGESGTANADLTNWNLAGDNGP